MVFFKLLLEIITILASFPSLDDDIKWAIIVALYIIDLSLFFALLILEEDKWENGKKKKDKEEEDSDDKKAMVKDWFIDFFN